jgi:hypothetical protein
LWRKGNEIHRSEIWLAGKLFLYSSILFLPLVGIGAQWYVGENLAKPFNLGVLEWNLCTSVIAMATLGELAATGFVLLWLAAICKAVDLLRVRFSN